MKAVFITSNSECAHLYSSNTQSKWLDGTVVAAGRELSKSVTCQEWYITADCVLGEDGTIKRVNLSQQNVKDVPMPPPPPEPESCAETAKEGNGSATEVTTNIADARTKNVEENEMVAMAIMVVADPVVVAQVENTPAVAPLPLQIDVSPPLPPPLPLLPPPLKVPVLLPSPIDSIAEEA